MSNVVQSASKIVLIGFSLTVNVGFLIVIYFGIAKGSVKQEFVTPVIALYSSALSSVMTYYFSKRAYKRDDPVV